jgi:hypothetical protein
MFKDSTAAKGDEKAIKQEEMTSEQIALSQVMRGIHL